MENKNELLIAQTGVSDIEKKEIKKVNHILGTPFMIVTFEEGSFVAMGKYRLTEFQPTEEDARNLIPDFQEGWDFLLNVISAIVSAEQNNF